MGTGYTRNDTSNNIADGNVINASDFDGEFNAIESAMGTSGHTHDGTAAEGGPITVAGPAQDLVVSGTEVKPKTDNTLDLGTASLQFKNAFFQGTIDTDGIMTAATFEPDGDTAAGDNAAIGYTAAEGLILTGQGSTNDVTIKNDADADVIEIPTGTTNVTVAGNLGVGGTVTGTGTSVFASLDISGDIDVDGTTNLDVVDIDGAVDMASTLGVAGVVTANAGVVVDNITIDGTEIDLSSGDLTIDVAGDIILDADDGDVSFRDAGVGFLNITNSSTDAVIQSLQNDKDLIFKGVDNSNPVTALTLDMSDAGTAIFNNKVGIGATPATNTYLHVDVGTNLNFEVENSSSNLRLSALNDARDANVGMQFASSAFEFLTGQALFTDGSNSAPSISNSGDTDTGFFFPAANTLGFATAGGERLRINAGSELQLGGTTNSGFIDFDGSNLQLGTQRNPNTGAFTNTSKSQAGINLRGASNDSHITFRTTDSNNTAASLRWTIDKLGNFVFTGNTQIQGAAQDTALFIAGGNNSNDGANITLFGSNDSPANETRFRQSASESMRINADGKLLIGSDTSGRASLLQVHTPASGGGDSILLTRDDTNTDQQVGSINFGNNSDSDLGLISVKTTGAANSGAMIFSTASAGTTSEVFRVDKDRVATLTSTQSSTYALTDGGISNYLVFNNTGTTSSQNAGIQFSLSKSGETGAITEIGALRTGNGESAFVIRTRDSGTGRNERCRVTSGGSFLVGTTLVGSLATQNSDAGLEISSGGRIFTCTTASGHHDMNKIDDGTVFRFREATNVVGSISVDSSGTTYAQTSDYRLKENVVDLTGATSRLKQLKPSRFNFKANKDKTVDGFLAHEAQTVVPEAVTGTKDGLEVWKNDEELPDGVSVGDNKLDADGNTIPEYQGIDNSKLVPLLVKTIQELEARITALEA